MEIVNWKKGLDRMFSDTHKHNSAVHTPWQLVLFLGVLIIMY